MAICVIKVCRNYKGRLKTAKLVTFHRIPSDPVLRSKWVKVIRKSRGEDVWKPMKCSVICSDHFRAKDMYCVNKRRRLKKKAIPSKALFLSSLQSDDDESDDSVKDTGKKSDCVTNDLDDTKSLESIKKESCDVTTDPLEINSYASSCMETSENITDKASGSTSSKIGGEQETENGQATDSKIVDERKTENESEIEEDFSDLDSVYDSPGKSKMRRQLRRKIRLQEKHTSMIQSLRKKNQRLQKKVASLKKIIETLIKKRDIMNRQRHK